ncbi:cation diffusion facilitator family transporter [Chitinophaga japonensis]|uniref:Cobalt-zinc-cadmium efflux system protein n=1 Tax=Chitinophaga japonensis TaxID=104662 RepID=A0A562TCJ6_CHIJA|nr:cation diffusion facilitator family transporter [Chitinophaga japonensis]TWI90720.1 cobalt-zinc-cadmium efflux system protein [Chitinophaga japonensis]
MSHHHQHTHAPAGQANLNRAFIWGIAMNLGFVIVEFVVGLLNGSLALLSDAGHNLSDVASLALSLLAFRLARVKSSSRYTYGYRKSTILISLLNALILLVAVGAIAYEALRRFSDPAPVPGSTMAIVAGIGIFVNTASAFLFFKDKESDLNVKGAYLHLVADALVSLGAVVAGLVIMGTGWYWVDPVVSLLIIIVIVYSTWGLLRSSLRLSLDAVPPGIDMEEVRKTALQVPGVKDIYHIHIWAMSTTENALTAQLVVKEELDRAAVAQLKNALRHELEHLGIHHVTLETNFGEKERNIP